MEETREETREEARKEARHQTLEKMHETSGMKNGGIVSSIKTFYYLTIGYFTDRPKYKTYWDVTEFLYEKKYGKKYSD